jgi:hypothetical protein
MDNMPSQLPPFHPMTILRDWSEHSPDACFRLADAQTGVVFFGATGSGKTSSSRHLALSYLAYGFGGVVLCAKSEERRQWEEWASIAKRTDDLIIFDTSGKWRFNFLDWEASRPGAGGGFTINVVALLDEIAGALASGAGEASESGSGDNRFFDDALHHMNMNLVDLPLFAGLPVSLPLLREIVNTAALTPAQAMSDEWWRTSVCAATLKEAEAAVREADEETRADFRECRAYWLQEYPALSEKTRSIITLSFSMLVRPFITRPLRRLFSTDTNVTPEDTFDGKIIIVDLPVQEFRLAGRVANLLWKFCFQVSTLRRSQPGGGSYLRPVFLWADEVQNFVTDFDAEYQAVARSAGGCTVYLVQNRESLLRVLRGAAAVDSLLGNLQCKFFCQNSGETNDWAAKLLGERYVNISGTNIGRSTPPGQDATVSGGVTRSEQRRYYVEPARFATLKRGGPANGYQVETIVYKGGHRFHSPDGGELLPYALLTFNQQ